MALTCEKSGSPLKRFLKRTLRAGSKKSLAPGTAAVISPVGGMTWEEKSIVVADGGMGELTSKLYDTLTGMQYGTVADEFGWIKTI